MGVLYDTVMEQKRKFLIQELHKMNVFKSENGADLERLDYEELKYEYVLASFRQVDVNHPSYKYF